MFKGIQCGNQVLGEESGEWRAELGEFNMSF